jgi:SPP1 gp7 family putative phage head morphogenesis protein
MAQNADILTNDEVDALIVAIYLGQIDIYNLPTNLYNKTTSYLAEGLIEGFEDIATAEEQALIESLFANIQAFSAAKTYHEISDLQSLIYKNGKIVEFAEFRKEAIKELAKYNKAYLETEYLYTTENARAAKRWTRIWNDRNLLGCLEYVTVGDDRVRPAHRTLNGTVQPVTSSFWNTYYPPIGYRCRCTTKSHECGDVQITEILSTVENKASVHPIKIDRQFRFNSGKKKIIFSPYHPYFTDVPERLKSWALNNFGLPMVKNIPNGK